MFKRLLSQGTSNDDVLSAKTDKEKIYSRTERYIVTCTSTQICRFSRNTCSMPGKNGTTAPLDKTDRDPWINKSHISNILSSYFKAKRNFIRIVLNGRCANTVCRTDYLHCISNRHHIQVNKLWITCDTAQCNGIVNLPSAIECRVSGVVRRM